MDLDVSMARVLTWAPHICLFLAVIMPLVPPPLSTMDELLGTVSLPSLPHMFVHCSHVCYLGVFLWAAGWGRYLSIFLLALMFSF